MGVPSLNKTSVHKSQMDGDTTCPSYSGDSQSSVDLRDQRFVSHRGDYPLTILGKKDGSSGIDRADGPRRRSETRVKSARVKAKARSNMPGLERLFRVGSAHCVGIPVAGCGVCWFLCIFVFVKIYREKW